MNIKNIQNAYNDGTLLGRYKKNYIYEVRQEKTEYSYTIPSYVFVINGIGYEYSGQVDSFIDGLVNIDGNEYHILNDFDYFLNGNNNWCQKKDIDTRKIRFQSIRSSWQSSCL